MDSGESHSCGHQALPPIPSATTQCTDYGDYGEDISTIIAQYAENDPPTHSASAIHRKYSQFNSSKRRLTETCSACDAGPAKRPKVDDNMPLKEEQPYLIAHSNDLAFYFATQNVPYGVQYEIARLLSLGRLKSEDVTIPKLKILSENNSRSAPETARTFLSMDPSSDEKSDAAFAQERAARSPWEELDREEKAFAINEFAGLGNSEVNPGWYGGKVEFRGKLQLSDDGYQISLDRCAPGASCRFTRRFGSKKFLRIKIPTSILYSDAATKKRKTGGDLVGFFLKPFVLWGRVFRSFYAKDDTVFLFQTNEAYEAGTILPNKYEGLSLVEFLDWHNPLEANSNQSMTKWAARFALGLSTSVPGPIVKPENIRHEDDIESAQGSDMTDGCGFADRSVHMAIWRLLKCDPYPTAFQFRLRGEKGMLLERRHVDPRRDTDGTVFVRPSQTKIRYPHDRKLDPAQTTIDILRTCHMRTPACINTEMIINLAENGVPHRVFENLLRKSLAEIVEGLTTWEGPDAMLNLWANVERAGGVFFMRKVREAGGEARVRGLGHRFQDGTEDDLEEDEDGLDSGFDAAIDQRSSAWWADPISGCPSSLEETVMVLLDSGFEPGNCAILREKLKQVVTAKIKSRAAKFRYQVPCSLSAFVVPDPCNVLGPGEIYIKSPQRNLMGNDGLLTDTIVGDVLLTRNPCKVPTDVLKFKAVDHVELQYYAGVIICSVRDERRLLSLLAGGDYDGDTAVAIWDHDIVSNFTNADLKYSKEPLGVDKCFSPHNEKVDHFVERIKSKLPADKMQEMQRFLLGSLRDTTIVGKYSAMHDNAVYRLGYSHPRTIRLAYIFCRVLDGAKTGDRILPETYQEDAKKYEHLLGPHWKAKTKKLDEKKFDTSNTTYLSRNKNEFIKGAFIMDVLLEAAIEERRTILIKIDELFTDLDSADDPDLRRPWLTAVERIKHFSPEMARLRKRDLSLIAEHVAAMYREHGWKIKGRGKKGSFTTLPIEQRQDILRTLSMKFRSLPELDQLQTIDDEETLARLRASYAFVYDLQENRAEGKQQWSRFPWNMAMRVLCDIKTSALGKRKSVITPFYEKFKLSLSKH